MSTHRKRRTKYTPIKDYGRFFTRDPPNVAHLRGHSPDHKRHFNKNMSDTGGAEKNQPKPKEYGVQIQQGNANKALELAPQEKKVEGERKVFKPDIKVMTEDQDTADLSWDDEISVKEFVKQSMQDQRGLYEQSIAEAQQQSILLAAELQRKTLEHQQTVNNLMEEQKAAEKEREQMMEGHRREREDWYEKGSNYQGNYQGNYHGMQYNMASTPQQGAGRETGGYFDIITDAMYQMHLAHKEDREVYTKTMGNFADRNNRYGHREDADEDDEKRERRKGKKDDQEANEVHPILAKMFANPPEVFKGPTALVSAEKFLKDFERYTTQLGLPEERLYDGISKYLQGETELFHEYFRKLEPDGDFALFKKSFKAKFRDLPYEERLKNYAHRKQQDDME